MTKHLLRELEHDTVALANAGRAYGYRALALIALGAIAVHDSLTLRTTLSEDNSSQASCEQPSLGS